MALFLQPTAMVSNPMQIPDDLAKEMKTEDQILAQLRASQNLPAPIPFPNEPPPPPIPTNKLEDHFPPSLNIAPNLEQLQKLIQESPLKETVLKKELPAENKDLQVKIIKHSSV